MMKKFLMVVVVCGAAFVGMRYQEQASKADRKKCPSMGRMIDVGGYKLHMLDSQSGQYTVVLDGAIGDTTLDWCLTQPEIAKHARVVSYDRAGYAWSDASPLERTSGNIVQELHTMLHNAKIPAPYILVGNAFGGMNMRMFADQYPDEVAGLVLINTDASGCVVEKSGLLRSVWLYLVDVANYTGCLRLFAQLQSQQDKLQNKIAKYPKYLQPIYHNLMHTTNYVHAMIQEQLLLSQSCLQVQQAHKDLGNKPCVMIPVYDPSAISIAIGNMVYDFKQGGNAQ